MSWAYDTALACRVLLGTVFVVSVASKVRSRSAWRSFSSWLTGLPLRPASHRGAPAGLVAAESAVVLLVAWPEGPAAGLITGSVLCLALTIGLVLALRRGSRQPCQCLGSSSEPLGGQHVVRNALLLVLAVIGIVSELGNVRPAGDAEAALAVIGGLAAAMVITFLGDITALLMPPARPASGAAPPWRAGTR
jgi:hypothetical protein